MSLGNTTSSSSGANGGSYQNNTGGNMSSMTLANSLNSGSGDYIQNGTELIFPHYSDKSSGG